MERILDIKRRTEELSLVIDQQEVDMREILGPTFNPMNYVYEDSLQHTSQQDLTGRLVSDIEEDEIAYHRDLVALAMGKQEAALVHLEHQIALNLHSPSATLQKAIASDHDVVERLGLKISEMRRHAVNGQLQDIFDSATMIDHYAKISDRFMDAAKGIALKDIVAKPTDEILETIADVRQDFAQIAIAQVALGIGAVHNKIGQVERMIRFYDDGIIKEKAPLVAMKYASYAFMREVHGFGVEHLAQANQWAESASAIRAFNDYVPDYLSYRL
jgi:hypothetical protein